jgi:tetratricopeptide (TPR) repeat protein
MAKSLGKNKARDYTKLLVRALLLQNFELLQFPTETASRIRPLKNQPKRLYVKSHLAELEKLIRYYIDSKYLPLEDREIATKFLNEENSKQSVKDVISYLMDLSIAFSFIAEPNSEDREFYIQFPYTLKEFVRIDENITKNLIWLMSEWDCKIKTGQSRPTLDPLVLNLILGLFPRSLSEYAQDRVKVLQPILAYVQNVAQKYDYQSSAEIAMSLIRFLIANQRWQEAQDLLLGCDRILNKYPFESDRLVGDRYYYQGLIYLHREQLEEAAKFLVEAKNIRIDIFGGVHPLVADTIHNLGTVYARLNNYDQAEMYFTVEIELRKKLPFDLAIANSLNSLAEVLVKREHFLAIQKNGYGEFYREDNLGRAIDLYDQAIEIVQSHTNNHPYLAFSKIGKGNIMAKQGKLILTETLYNEAFSILENIFGKQHHELAQPLAGLASIHQLKGNHALAKNLYHEAIQLLTNTFGQDHPAIALYQENMNHSLRLDD